MTVSHAFPGRLFIAAASIAIAASPAAASAIYLSSSNGNSGTAYAYYASANGIPSMPGPVFFYSPSGNSTVSPSNLPFGLTTVSLTVNNPNGGNNSTATSSIDLPSGEMGAMHLRVGFIYNGATPATSAIPVCWD